MLDMVTMEIELTSALADCVRQAVSIGKYPSIDAVVQQAVGDWCQKQHKIKTLREALIEGENSGEPRPFTGLNLSGENEG